MSESEHYDVLVVRAGIVGLSTAHHIKENHREFSVLVIDRNAASGQGETSESMAGIRDTFTLDVNPLLAGSTIAFYKHVQSRLGFNLNLKLIGYLWLLTCEEFRVFEGIEAGMRREEYAADDISRAFSFEEEPIAEEPYFTYNIYPILSEYFPRFANLRPVNSWAGLYDINSLDSAPIIGRIANCIIVTGVSGSGIMKADAVGRMAAAIYDGKGEAFLFRDKRISTTRLGLTNRSVGKEEFVI